MEPNQPGTASWVLIIIAVVSNTVLRRALGYAGADLVVMTLVLAALVSAVVGLIRAKGPPPRRKAGAIVGLVLSLLLIAIFLSNFIAGIARA